MERIAVEVASHRLSCNVIILPLTLPAGIFSGLLNRHVTLLNLPHVSGSAALLIVWSGYYRCTMKPFNLRRSSACRNLLLHRAGTSTSIEIISRTVLASCKQHEGPSISLQSVIGLSKTWQLSKYLLMLSLSLVINSD